jgi:hypothetical protein
MMNLPEDFRGIADSDFPKVSPPGYVANLQRIRFGDLLEPLRHAAGQGQSWLNDFCNDDILLPQDLVDVIQAFAQMQAGTARSRLKPSAESPVKPVN